MAPLLQMQNGKWEQSKYYYPARLLYHEYEDHQRKWRVDWWPAIFFRGLGPDPGALVDEANIVDGLWLDTTARRKIRVCLIVHISQALTCGSLGAGPMQQPLMQTRLSQGSGFSQSHPGWMPHSKQNVPTWNG